MKEFFYRLFGVSYFKLGDKVYNRRYWSYERAPGDSPPMCSMGLDYVWHPDMRLRKKSRIDRDYGIVTYADKEPRSL